MKLVAIIFDGETEIQQGSSREGGNSAYYVTGTCHFKDRDTGGSRGAMAPSKIFSSCCSKSLFFYNFSISEYVLMFFSFIFYLSLV